MNFGFHGAGNLAHRVQRDGIQALFHPEHQGLDDGQRERELQTEGCALAHVSFHVDRGFQPLEHALHHVHSDAASGNFGDFFCGAESGAEDEVQGLAFGQARRFFRRHHSQFERFGANFLGVDAAAIVADLDHHLIALVIGIQLDLSPRRLAQAPAFLGRFNAVADRVPHQMRQGFGDGVENAFVEVGLLTGEFQIHFAAALPRHIAHDAREAAE